MRLYITAFLLLTFTFLNAQTTTIRAIIMEPTDQVFITGNQEGLGDWDPSKVKMKKVSDTEFVISLDLSFPAEFKFTHGSWDSEGIAGTLDNNPNQIINSSDEKSLTYIINGWKDTLKKDSFTTTYSIETIHSKLLDQDRRLKVYVPNDYSSDKSYPVIYLTDAGYSPNFEVVVQYLKQLLNFEVIPSCVIVGIEQVNRHDELDVYFSEKGQLFRDFIFDEVVPFVNKQYNTSDFNMLIGHSDGATYTHLLMTSENSPFRGFISISEAVFNNQLETIANFLKSYKNDQNLYWFVANGTYDAEFRIDSGKQIDSVVKSNQNSRIHYQQETYLADHNNLVAKSVLDGIQFIFKDYQHLNNPQLVDSLNNSGANPIIFWKDYTSKIFNSYGVELEMNDYDFYTLADMAVSQKDTILYGQVQSTFKDFSFINEMEGYSLMAQDYERMGFYDNALTFWRKNLEKNTFSPFFYQRPANLLAFKLNKPKEAIAFLEKSIKDNPEFSLYFHYYIANIAIKKRTLKSKAKQSLAYCENNYVENIRFSIDELQQLKEKLKAW